MIQTSWPQPGPQACRARTARPYAVRSSELLIANRCDLIPSRDMLACVGFAERINAAACIELCDTPMYLGPIQTRTDQERA
jgi:hypothetical protein